MIRRLMNIDGPITIAASNSDLVCEATFLHWKLAFASSRNPIKSTSNEDVIAFIPFDSESGIVMVADGMGGHAAGEVASRLAAESLTSELGRAADSGAPLRAGILDGLEAANRAIIELANGAGTTVSVLELSRDGVRPYHVGDSLICAVGNRGKVKLRTTAHSPVGFGIAAGLLDDEDAHGHEEAHVVLNAMGFPEMRIEVGPTVALARRDTMLLASDGLSDNLNFDEIRELIRKGPLLQSTETLVKSCQRRMLSDEGKPDDLTVVTIRAN